MKIKYTKQEKQEQINQLRELLDKSERKVYAIVKYVSSNGMNRGIDFYCFTIENNKVVKNWLSHKIAGILLTDYVYILTNIF